MRRHDKSFAAAKASRLTGETGIGRRRPGLLPTLEFRLVIPGLTIERALGGAYVGRATRVGEMRPPPSTTRFTGAKASIGTAIPL